MKYNAPFGAANPDAPYVNGNPSIGVAGSIPPAESIEYPQREIVKAITDAGIVPNNNDLGQLSKAIRQTSRKSWFPVKSLNLTTPPENNTFGDIYVIAQGSKGDWSDKTGQLAEWNGKTWTFIQPPDGHGIGLPDGSIYIKIAGKYVLLTDLLDSRYSRLIAPPVDTFYVIGSSGSDENTGLNPTPEEGFATIQGAINAISGRYITYGKIKLKISPGIYDGFSISASLVQNWEIIGDQKNRTAYRIIAKNSASRAGIGCVAYASHVSLRGLSFQTEAQNIVSTTGSAIDIFDCSVTATSTSTPFASYGGSLTIYGQINVSGAGDVIFDLQNGKLEMGFKDQYVDNTVYVNFSNCRCITVFSLTSGSTAIINPSCCKFSGSITGRKYTIVLNSVMQTYGGGTNFLFGDSAGIISTGGQIS